MQGEYRQVDYGTYVLRALASAVAVAVSGFFAFSFMWMMITALESVLGNAGALFVGGGVAGGVFGAGISVGPLLILQARGIESARWIGVSTVAAALGLAISTTVFLAVLQLGESLPDAGAGALIGFSLGLPLSVGQWLLLRQRVERALLWVPMCTLSLVVAFAAGLPLGGEGREWIAVSTIGLVWALLSVPGMSFLTRRIPVPA